MRLASKARWQNEADAKEGKRRRVFRPSRPQSYLWSFDYLHMRPLLRDIWNSRELVRGLVLDVGCGNQPYRRWFEATECYVGLDPDSIESQPNVVGLGERLPFRDGAFDTVLCLQTIEHIPDPFAVMAEIARVIKLGGHLVLTAPQAWRVHEPPHDYFRFTRYGLRYLIESSGLTILRLKAQGGAWALIGQTILTTVPHRQLRYLTAPFVLLINLLFLLLDAIWHDEKDTLNYIVVAQRPFL